MQLNFLPDQNYDCIRCGLSCKHDWNIHVDQARVENIRSNYKPLAAIEAVQPAFVEEEGDITLGRTASRQCVFLNDECLCGVHSTMGMDAKPRDCQHYPVTMVETPDGIQVAISYSCTAALTNQGRPLDQQAESVTHWLKEFQPTKLGFEPSAVFDDVTIDWPAYLHLETQLKSALEQLDCERALWSGLLLLRHCIMQKIANSADAELKLADVAEFKAETLATIDVQFPEEIDMQIEYFGLLQLGFIGTCDRDSQQAMLDPFDEESVVGLPSLHWRGNAALLRKLLAKSASKPQHEAELKRYFSALLFQKKLLNDANLWTGLIKLCMLPRLVRQAATLLGNGAYQDPHLNPYQQALRVVEQDVVSHNASSSKLYGMLGTMLIAG